MVLLVIILAVIVTCNCNEVKVFDFTGEGTPDDKAAILTNAKTFYREFEQVTFCASFLFHQINGQYMFGQNSNDSSIR